MKIKNPSAILCSDFHIRDDIPICRMDDYFSALENKIHFISNLQKKYKCSIFFSGDLFHKNRVNPNLEQWTILNLPTEMHIISGNHDILNHNIKNYNKSSIGVIEVARKDNYFYETPLDEIQEIEIGKGVNKGSYKIGMIHTFIQKPKDKQDKIIGGSSARAILKKYSQCSLIVSGDNHKSFTYEYEGRLLVNPGSLMRTTAGQIDHKPVVYLWDSKSNTVEPVYIPIEDNVLSREHIETKEKRDQRIEAFVNRLDHNIELSMSFENNMHEFIKKNKVRNGVKDMIMEAME